MGTGTGDLAIAAAQMYPGARIVGVDFTPEMLERGREKLERLNLGERVRLQVAMAPGWISPTIRLTPAARRSSRAISPICPVVWRRCAAW